ncbi:MAG: hypothetical protein ACR2LS_03910 [Thermomicrobiales bacterium]
MQTLRQFLVTTTLAALVATMLPLAASAHERREVGNGQYELVVGFLDEPAFVGLKNGLDLRVTNLTAAATPEGEAAEGAAGVPIEGLAATIQAEVIRGDQSMALPITPRFGEPGAYRSVFFPMEEGDYIFHIVGEIEGVAIDETFDSGPETFGPVEAVDPLQFPKQDAGSAKTGIVAAGMADRGGNDNGLGGLPGGSLGLLAVVGLAGFALFQRRGIFGRK